MADIYHYIANNNLSNMSNDELREILCIYKDAYSGIMSGLQVMGECALWASANEDYPEGQAQRDLYRLGNALQHLPRIAKALNQGADDAKFTLYRREGLSLSEEVR
ncbi:hypothetical protein QE210_12230 [Arsenophonus nasoniae]|uniref:Uncharacterized protein n=2 Tax=Arsenophonus nasoniae TaxID=638 RepID=A0AA95KCM3_9GAMM|nr:hypothetical protein QE210_12230 [Arsenophonus nasoniae]